MTNVTLLNLVLITFTVCRMCSWCRFTKHSSLSLSPQNAGCFRSFILDVILLSDSVCLSVCLSLPLSLSLSLSVSLSLCLCLSVCLSPSVCLSVRPSVRPSVRLSVCLSVCLSLENHVWRRSLMMAAEKHPCLKLC